MRLEQLEYVIEIAKQKSMNIASEHLHLTPQTLSISMKNLEQEMGFLIFNHTSKGTTLTQNGELVLKFALKTVAEYQQIIASCSSKVDTHSPPLIPDHLQGNLTIYSNPIITTAFLPYYTRIFLNLYPGVKLTTLSGTTQFIFEKIINSISNVEKNTLGIVVLPFAENLLNTDFIPPNENLHLKVINTSQYYCCVSRTSSLAKHKTLSIRNLLSCPLILYTMSENKMTPLVYLFKQYNIDPEIILSLSTIPSWVQAISDNLGIGFINGIVLSEDSYLKDHLNQLQIIKVKEPLISIYGFLYPSEPTQLMKSFMNLWPDYSPPKSNQILSSNPILLARN